MNVLELYDSQIREKVSYCVPVVTRIYFLNQLLNILLCAFRKGQGKTDCEVIVKKDEKLLMALMVVK